jgi:hypothetical protein
VASLPHLGVLAGVDYRLPAEVGSWPGWCFSAERSNGRSLEPTCSSSVSSNKGSRTQSRLWKAKLRFLHRPAVVAREEGTMSDGASDSSSRPAVEARGSRSCASSSSSLLGGQGWFVLRRVPLPGLLWWPWWRPWKWGLDACSGGFVLERLFRDYWRLCARHCAGLNDNRAAALLLLLPVRWHSSVLCPKWCVPGGAVAGWRRWWSSIWKKKLGT